MSSQPGAEWDFSSTAIVIVDVYNEFMHPEGKINSYVNESSATKSTSHLTDLVSAAGKIRTPIYYSLHQTWKEGNFEEQKRMSAATTRLAGSRALKEASWGAEISEGLQPDILEKKDVVVSKH